MKPARPKALLSDLRQFIAEARRDVARQVNSALVLLYWRIGQRIRQDILKEKRAEHGRQIIEECPQIVSLIMLWPRSGELTLAADFSAWWAGVHGCSSRQRRVNRWMTTVQSSLTRRGVGNGVPFPALKSRAKLSRPLRGGFTHMLQIVSAVGRELTAESGQGFSEKNLWRMVQFAEVFPDEQIVASLMRQLQKNALLLPEK
jgi:hypothetical protein